MSCLEFVLTYVLIFSMSIIVIQLFDYEWWQLTIGSYTL